MTFGPLISLENHGRNTFGRDERICTDELSKRDNQNGIWRSIGNLADAALLRLVCRSPMPDIHGRLLHVVQRVWALYKETLGIKSCETFHSDINRYLGFVSDPAILQIYQLVRFEPAFR